MKIIPPTNLASCCLSLKTMDSIPLEITIKSACILKSVNFLCRRRIYIVVSLIGSNNSFSKQKTNIDTHNGSKPFWWYKMKFHVERSKIHANSCMLVFQVRCSKTLGDKDIGYLYIPVRELFEGDGGARDVAYTVTTASGKPKGILYMKYEFGENIMIKRIDKEISRVLPPPSAPPLEGFWAGTTSSLAPSAPPYEGQVEGEYSYIAEGEN